MSIPYNLPMIETGIKDSVVECIRSCAESHGQQRVVLFGSRARGQHRPKSDIDLAVSGGDQARFELDVEEQAPTLLKFDFINMDGPISQELQDRVAAEGVVLYEKVR